MRQIKLTIAATETSCETETMRCGHTDREWCAVFLGRVLVSDGMTSQYKRLPECIAAEKEAGK